MGSAQGSNPSIRSRDRDGTEHMIGVVDHPAGLVTIYDDDMVRILAPAAAIELGILLIQAARGHFRGIVGPISGSF